MKKLTVAVIDDEEDARELIKIHLKRFGELELVGEGQNGLEAIQLITRYKPDIVLLDIQMPEMDGLEVISQLEDPPAFIFVTAYDEFAVKAFELNAVDYLLKPFTEERFDQSMRRAKADALKDQANTGKYLDLLDLLNSRQTTQSHFIRRLAHRSGLKTTYISTDEICLIEAADQYVYTHTKEAKHLMRLSMDHLEQMLDPDVFFRSHRSFIIRIDQVRAVEQYEPRNFLIHLKSGHQAKLSQSRKDQFSEKLMGRG